MQQKKPGGKKRKREVEEDDTAIEDIKVKLISVESKLSQIMDVSPTLPLPLGFLSLLHDAFSCCICKGSPITPPAIFARCCRSIIGCKRCVDQWYKGDQGVEKRCPLCRGERGFADTSIVHGLDDFLVYLGKVAHHVPPPPDEIPLLD